MNCSCKKLNGYLISKCGYHYGKRKTIFQLYQKARLELAALKTELGTAHNTASLAIAAQAVVDSWNAGDYHDDFTESILRLRDALQQQA